MRWLIVFITLLSLCSCANPYRDYYRPDGRSTQTERHPRNHKIQHIHSSDMEYTHDELTMSGHERIGRSSFESSNFNPDDAESFGRTVGADVVVTFSELVGIRNGFAPMIMSTPGKTITTDSSGYMYGGGNTVQYYGQSTTYIPGETSVNYVPYSYRVYRCEAAYYRIDFIGRLGVIVTDLPYSVARNLGNGIGVQVNFVRRGSPADKAGISLGDVITKIDDVHVLGKSSFAESIKRMQGKTVLLSVFNAGNTEEKKVPINLGSP